MLIVFIGPPGAGKGTQSSRLTTHLGIPHLSTGELLRAAKASGSPQGKVAAQYFDRGQLVPDPLVVQLVAEKMLLPEFSGGCLLDGFPRTLGQARSLDECLAARGASLDVAIELHADPELLVNRMLQRAKRENREDDTLDTIRKRIEVYRAQTAPLLEYYRAQGKLCTIDALGAPDEVFHRILSEIAPLRK